MVACLARMCTPATFTPSVFGAEVLSVSAQLVTNFSSYAPSYVRFAAPSVNLTNAAFCNVTVTYTHPGQGDKINVEAWLPTNNWNARLQAVGGGAYVAGRFQLSYPSMIGAIAEGFATTTTDAGISTTFEVSPWALKSPGNVDWNNLQNLAHVSLSDQAVIGKSLVKSFYGQEPDYSYFTGCSQGGRQGLMLAQRYPTEYDGILSAAPAIYWSQTLMTIHWSQQIMNELGEYPPACEFEAIAQAAVKACDALDGIEDGIITNVDDCLASFDPFSLVGETIKCTQTNGTQLPISNTAAAVANATWHGITTEGGEAVWYGLSPGTDISGRDPRGLDVVTSAMTNCNGTKCVGAPVLGNEWIESFLFKGNPDMELTALSRGEFHELLHDSVQQYQSILDTMDPNLTKFRKSGGKMLTYHGTLDQLIPLGGTEKYYGEVTKIDPNVRDFFRVYVAPGLGHCYGGRSGQPEQMFQQLRDWVEKDKVPGQTPVKITAPNGKEHDRILCPYPEVAVFDKGCGNAADATCWSCNSS